MSSVVQLVEAIAKSLVDNPDAVFVTETEEKQGITIQLKVAPEDMGKVIGKQGRIARALRTVVRAAATKENKKVIIDVIGREGNILDKKVINVFLSLDGEEIYYINEDELSKIESLLSDSEIKKHGYDLKEDYILLKPYEIELNAMDFDITIAEYLIDSKSSTSYECSAIAMKYLTRKIKSKEDLLGKGAKAKKFDEIDFDELSAYTADIINTIACVYPKMEEKLKETEMDGLFYHVEMPLVEVLGSMEYIGMKVDKDQLNELKEKFTTIINELENEKTNIIMPIINEDEIPKGPEARNKYLLRLVKEFLQKNKTKVVSWLRKIPGIGNKMADFFNNNLGKFISILDSWEAGVEGAVYKFWRLIFAPAQAQTATNFTMMILSFFIPGL